MEVSILGPLEVRRDSQRVSLPKGRGLSLLALLALRAGEVVSPERLIDELWGETPPPTVVTALQGLVSKLRKRLEPDRAEGVHGAVLQTHPAGYSLVIDPGQVDANRFRRLVGRAQQASTHEKASILRRALGLWRGPALADFTYEPFAQTEIAILEELRLNAVEGRIDADLALGGHAGVLTELQALAAEHPLRERIVEQLMLALYRSSRQGEALEAYVNTRRALVDELGIEPGRSLQQLQGAILRQDPSLDLKPASLEVTSELPSPGRADTPRPWLAHERKTVTLMFVDVTVSNSSGHAAEAERADSLVARFFAAAAGIVIGHGGIVEELAGDALFGVFGIPTAREDDALRAVRAAVDLRHAHAALNRELATSGEIQLATRVGINTGEVVIGDERMRKATASGAAVKEAARLQQAAVAGEILVGDATRWLIQGAALLEPSARLTIAGEGSAPTVWRVLDLVPGAPPFVRHLDAPMVGRAFELSRLRAAYDQTIRERTGHRFTVLGEPGIGKSMLAREFGASLGSEAWVLTGHCPAYGDGITFWPLRDVVLAAAGGVDRDAIRTLLASVPDAGSIADQIAAVLGSAEDPASGDAPFPALRQFFEALARNRPIVLIFEDVHWAQPTFLDLIEYLADVTSAPVLLLCVARPDLLERRGAWVTEIQGGSLSLEPFGSDDTEKLIGDRLAGRPLPAETVTRIAQAAQGNPLFVEQMLASLGEETEVSIPASVQALLAARLDRLGPAERDLIRSASVLGTEFSLDALMPLIPEEARRFADRFLEALERKALILRSVRAASKTATLSFRHDLIQLAAYRSMTKETRARLHELVAEWFDAKAADGSTEFDEIIGHHLEQAHAYRRELGPLDAHGRGLAVRAGGRLAKAGLRAFARFDAAAAENLLSRSRALLSHDQPLGSEARRTLAEAYDVMGRHEDADAMLAELLEHARASGDRRLEPSLRLERARIRMATGPDPMSLDEIWNEAEQALKVFGGAGDEAGLARGCHLRGLVYLRRGRLRELEETARLGLAHADRSRSAREQLGARWSVSVGIVAGATPVRAGIPMCEELVRWRGTEHPGVLADLAALRSMLGEIDEARELIARARRLLAERTRARRPLGRVARRAGEVEINAGDVAVAEREFRVALTLGQEMGERDEISQVAAGLSLMMSMRGLGAEAATFASVSEEHAPAESVASQALWRSATARSLVARGEFREAERLARESIRLVPLEMLNLCGDLHLNLAEVLLATGKRKAAQDAAREAIDLYQRKGNDGAAISARAMAGIPSWPAR